MEVLIGKVLGWPLGSTIVVGVLGLLALQAPGTPARASLLAAPTPLAGAMSVYEVTNPNGTALEVQHVITNSAGFNYAFYSIVPAGDAIVCRLRDMDAVPNPFVGDVALFADQSFTAEVVGYDYPDDVPSPGADACTVVSEGTLTPSPEPTADIVDLPTPGAGHNRVYLPNVVN